MRTLTKQSIGLVLLTVLVLGSTTTGTANWILPYENTSFELHRVVPNQYLIPDVPYVWQEVNGLCAWAALTMVFQYWGIDTTLAQVLDVSGVGFAFYYLRADPTLLFLPGPLCSQDLDSDFLATTYGLSLTWYFGEDTPGLGQLTPLLEQQGMNTVVLTSFTEGVEHLKQDLTNNTPLVISVNPLRFSTVRDYQALGLPPDTLAGHGVVVVGYNETHVFINDPGVGAIGPEYGYPTDQRGIATPIPLEDFQRAWEDRSLTAMKFLPTHKSQLSTEALRSHTIERIIAKLEGDYHAYAYSQPLMWLGADAVVQMGEDLHPAEFEEILTSWEAWFGSRTQLISTLDYVKLAYLGTLTLNHESMKRAATDLFGLFQGLNSYTDALELLTDTLDQFEALVDPAVLQYVNRTNLTLFDEAFDPVIQTLSANKSIEQAVQAATSQLEALGTQIKSLGTTLKTFSTALKEASSTPTRFNLQLILQFALLGGVIVLVAELIRRKIRRDVPLNKEKK